MSGTRTQDQETGIHRAIGYLLRKYGKEKVLAALDNADEHIFPDEEVRRKGIPIRTAARQHDVPADFLWRWSESGLIPIHHKGNGPGQPTYIDKKAAKKAAEIYHRAKVEGKKPISRIQRKCV